MREPRREFSASTRRAAWQRANGQCENIRDGVRCSAPIEYGRFHYDHVDPSYFSGDADLSNCQVICLPCHREKTAKDVGNIAKSKRIIDKRIDARRPKGQPMPGTKRSGIRKRMSGKVEWRAIR